MQENPPNNPSLGPYVIETLSFGGSTTYPFSLSISPAAPVALPTPRPGTSSLPSSVVSLYPWVPHADQLADYWDHPLEQTPRSLLQSVGGEPISTMSDAYASYTRSRKSLPRRHAIGGTLPVDEWQFVYLARYIELNNGNVTDFIFSKEHYSSAWARRNAAGLVYRALAAEQTHMVLPALPAEGMASISPHTIPPVVQALTYNRATMQAELQLADLQEGSPPPRTFSTAVQDGAENSETLQLTFVHVEHIFRHLLLDKALPYYAYIYYQDLQKDGVDPSVDGVRAVHARLTPVELSLLENVSYYEFVGAITYLGSLLLQAAQHYSRILYEGVYIMLLRAYCVLGILEWDQVNTKLLAQQGYEFFGDEFPFRKRFQLDQYPGHAYAQHGWEYFKRRSNALGYLADLTQAGLFHGSEYMSNNLEILRRNVSKTIECSSPLESGTLQYFFDTPKDLVHKYQGQGFVAAVLDRGATWMFGKAPPDRTLSSARAKRIKEKTFEYPPIPNFTEERGAQHELCVLAELSYFRIQEKKLIAEILEAQKEKIAGAKLLMSSRVKVQLHLDTALSVGLPPNYGLRSLPGEPAIYRIDFYEYLSQRLLCSPCRGIFKEIALKAFEKVKHHVTARIHLVNNYELQPSLGLDEYLRKSNNLREQIDVLEGVTQDEQKDFYTLSQAQAALLKFESFWTEYARPVKEIVVDTVKDYFRLNRESELSNTLDSRLAKRLLEVQGVPITPLRPWEWFSESENFERLLNRSSDVYVVSEEPTFESKQKQLVELVEEIKEIHAEGKERQKGIRPAFLYFVLPLIPHPLQTEKKVVMFVSRREGAYYVAFSGLLGGRLQGINRASSSIEQDRAIRYALYPLDFIPMKEMLTAAPYASFLEETIGFKSFVAIAVSIHNNILSRPAYKICTRSETVPAWLRVNNGANNARNAVVLYSKEMPKEVLKFLVEVHGLHKVSKKAWKINKTSIKKSTLKEGKVTRRKLQAKMELEQGERSTPFVARFTREQDRYMLENVRMRLSKAQKKEIVATLDNRPMRAITARCRTLATRMLNEYKVFDVNVLPILNITKAVRLQVTKNLEEQVLKYPDLCRAYMDAFNLRTEKELRDLFLKPRETPATKVLTLEAARARVLAQG